MNIRTWTLSRSFLAFLLVLTLFFFGTGSSARAQVGPDDSCSDKRVRDIVDVNDLEDKMKDLLDLSNVYKNVADKAAKAGVDAVELSLQKGGNPDDLDVLREHKEEIEKESSLLIEDFLRAFTGAGIDASHKAAADGRLPSGTDPGEFRLPDPYQLTLDQIRPIFRYDTPSLTEARQIIDKLGKGNLGGAVSDLLRLDQRLGIEASGSLANGWKWDLTGYADQPFDTPRPGARAGIKYDDGHVKFEGYIQGEYDRDTHSVETSAGLSLTIRIGGKDLKSSEGETRCLTPASFDTAPPLCSGTVSSDKVLTVTAQDNGVGLRSITVLKSENATVNVPVVDLGDPGPLSVLATKNDPAKRSVVELEVEDWVGNITRCDPLLANLQVGRNGRERAQTFGGIPREESYLTVYNGSPGLQTLSATVNGRTFKLGRLADGEERTVDLSSAMLPGQANTIRLQPRGEPGAGAAVLIHDSPDPRASKKVEWLPFLMGEN